MTFRLAKLYTLGAWGAAVCMLAICGLVTVQVVLRCLDGLLVLAGAERTGWEIGGVSEIAAYLLVGATFLSLAYTFVHHAHIRVTLVISRLPALARVWVESACLAVALTLAVVLGRGLITLIGESLEYGDLSSGLLAIPLWIPQSVLAIGVGLLCLALIEALIATLHTAFTAPSHYIAPEQHEEVGGE